MSVLIRQRTAAHEGLWTRLDQRGRMMVMLMIAAAVAVMGAQGTTLARALIGLAGLVVFVVIAFSHRDTALVMVVVWIVLLGFIRRFLIPFAGWSEQDPLLLVGPAAAITFLLAKRGEQIPRLTALAKLAVFLTLWSAIEVFNPREESLVVALQGAMFWIVPMLWFFVGRGLTGAQHDRILKAVEVVSAIVIVHGLYQTFFSLLPFEFTWLHVSGQGASIFVGGFKPRPFSTLTSPQEYGQFLSFALLIVWARILYFPPGGTLRYRRWLVVHFLAGCAALFYQGGRGNLAFFVVAWAIATVVRTRSVAAFLIMVIAAVGMASWVGGQDVESEGTVQEAEASGALARHQLSGLTNPSSSTLPEHISRIEEAITHGWKDPFGVGVSQESIAGNRAGEEGAQDGSTENDIAHTLQSLGTPAGFAYIAFLVAAYVAAVRMQRRRPSFRHLASLGMLIAATTQVWSGSLYATSTILFLALGGLARETGELVSEDEAARYGRARTRALAQSTVAHGARHG